jgi:DNA-binding transcriptional LysR family regulator
LLNFRTESKGLPVEIIIGAGESIIDWVLMPHLGVVRQNLRNTRLKFLNLSSTEVAHRLVDGMIDFGIVRKDVVARPLQWISLGVMNYSLFVPEALQVSGTGNYDRAKVLQTVPMATLEGEGSFRRDLSAISRKHRLRLQIEIECASFPLVARAVMTGAVAAVLPSVAASDLARLGVREVKISALDGLKRELCLAWNPRVLRIRTVLETARTVMTKAFTIPMA